MTVTEITFGNYPQSEFGLIPSRVDIYSPEVKKYLVSVPGRNGDLDFTESLDGIIRYENRTISMEMQCFADDEACPELEHKCRNLLHGKRMKLMFDSDPDYYYIGRLDVDWRSEPNIDIATITADCSPYKLKLQKTIIEQDIAGTAVITLTNECMPAMPTVTTDSEMTLEFDNKSVVVNAGTKLIPDLLLLAGNKEITVTGTGHIKFEYQEGAL